MPYLAEMDCRSGYVSGDIKDKGLELAESYKNASPFPHIVIEDFLPPAILELCLKEFPQALGGEDAEYDRAQERYKTQFNPDSLSDPVRTLFYSFNSKPFIRLVENITGIKGLIPDPYFLGAGFHQIRQEGHLSVHVDFNHHKPMNLERRINLLIYLNKDWREEYGGQLELWDADMKNCVRSFVPTYNRCVIFNTTESSYHGNPHPVNHPGGIPRRSIALYYYTSTWADTKRDHSTQFRVRPGTGDRVDMTIKKKEILVDLLPPILLRNAKRLRSLASR